MGLCAKRRASQPTTTRTCCQYGRIGTKRRATLQTIDCGGYELSDTCRCLIGSLNADSNIRIQAELKLAELFLLSTTPIELATICVTSTEDPHLRQIRISLGKYISERWSPFFPTWKGTSAPVEVKDQVRAIIFRGLSDSNLKIRTASAFVISKIAHSDWPDHYPTLLHDLISLLESRAPESVHGALQVFTEFSRDDLTEDQILPVLRQLLPILLSILGQAEQHSPLTRARAVGVFRQCITSVLMVGDQHPDAIQEATVSVLPQWLEAFEILLSSPPLADVQDSSNWNPLAIRMQIFRTLNLLHAWLPRILTPHLATLLSLAIGHLDILFPPFQHFHVIRDGRDPPPVTTADDPDQEISLPILAASIQDLLSQVARAKRAKDWFEDKANLKACVHVLAGWTQMTGEDLDANAFVAEQDDDSAVMSLRIAGIDFLQNLLDAFPLPTARELQAITQEVVDSSRQSQQKAQPDWWKPLEAILAVLGSEADALMQIVEDEQSEGRVRPFEVEYLLVNVIPSLLALSDYPFLQGRAFVFASSFAKLCRPVDAAVVRAYAPRILAILSSFLSTTSEDTLSLILDTLTVVVKIDLGTWLSPEVTSSLTAAILDTWRRNFKDPLLLSVLADLITTIAASPAPGVYTTLVSQLLPSLVQSLEAATANAQESWLASSALELIAGVLQGGEKGKLGDGLVAGLAPSLFDCINASQDRDVTVKGTECIALIVRKGCDQLLSWNDRAGRSGLDNVLAFVARLLSPTENEASGLLVGDLIIHLLRNTGEAILPILPQLLQTMVNRIPTAKTATFLQSLTAPFAFLIQTHRDTVISLLESITTPAGNGLEVFVRAWCDNAETFVGFWQQRVSTLAFCEMLLSNNAALRRLQVKGEQIIKPETRNVIMTRSRTKQMPVEYESITFPVKALKIILHDLQASVKPAEDDVKPENAESDDGDETWADEEVFQGMKNEEYRFLSGLSLQKVGYDQINNCYGLIEFVEDDGVEDAGEDEELRNDPISQMDMRTHLLSFLRQCAAADPSEFGFIASQLTEEEAAVVKQVLMD
ncbi:hypothetical protein BS47DRAFT_1371853 [Hydnum rufescens UP504]|uniref:ARM repeat-containing protein n=1 Tax=Hydnum rufescens UP504 TaxID=1448309 RepID=A0A9P6DYT8_9AGAM|nr:hypothetical protein BS47DRAFT_1371853 [Hydnum rufescens UP504]